MKMMRIALLMVATLGLGACVGPQARVGDEAAYRLQYTAPAQPAATTPAPSVLVNSVRAAPGLEGTRMAYQREANRLDYYARNRWVDTPAAMLQPLVVKALEAHGGFAAVVQGPAAVQAQRRLDLDLTQFVQDFSHTPSRMRVSVRAQVIASATQKVLATRVFETQIATTSEDARGGVDAANRALVELLPPLAAWVASINATP
jgi:cholesterol transport system auxiliary component